MIRVNILLGLQSLIISEPGGLSILLNWFWSNVKN